MDCCDCKQTLPKRNEHGTCIACLRARWARKRQQNICAQCGVRQGQRHEEWVELGEPNPRAKIVDAWCFGCGGAHRVCEECRGKGSVARGMFGETHIGLRCCPKKGGLADAPAERK